MKLLTFRSAGHERLGRMDADDVIDITESLRSCFTGGVSHMRSLIGAGPQVWAKAAHAEGPRRSIDELHVGVCLPDPTKIVAAPVNYVDHAHEMTSTSDINDLGMFLKAPSSVVGAGDVVRLPYSDRRFDHEGELGVVIGTSTRHVAIESALSHVFGYCCLLDMTMRGGEDRSTRKSFDSFTPIGPWIVTSDEIREPGSLDLTCTVNGVVRQSANTRDLIWDVPQLISYTSSVMTLHPGDIIATGTPAGVGPVLDGDELAVQISSIGRLAVTITGDGACRCPTRGASSGPVPPTAPAR